MTNPEIIKYLRHIKDHDGEIVLSVRDILSVCEAITILRRVEKLREIHTDSPIPVTFYSDELFTFLDTGKQPGEEW